MLRKSAQAIYRLLRRGAAAPFPPDFEPAEIADITAVTPYTMTSPERLIGLIRAVHHVVENRIPGDLVECGVWKGGSMMAVARVLLRLGDTGRQLWLFDTFEGMTPPTRADVAFDNQPADRLLRDHEELRCQAGLDAVRKAVLGTGYPAANVHFIPGRVEDTIPARAPEAVALLRLDTDWYESTRHELEHLFPRLARGGVLILDDYGHWQGARKAADEYFHHNRIPILLNRMDYTGRIGVKP
jgi:hypothetical protein